MNNKKLQQEKAEGFKALELMISEHQEKMFKIDCFQTTRYLIGKVRENPYSPQLQNSLQEIYKTNKLSLQRLNEFKQNRLLSESLKDNYLQ